MTDISGYTDKFRRTIVNYFMGQYDLNNDQSDHLMSCDEFWRTLINVTIAAGQDLNHLQYSAFITYMSSELNTPELKIESFNRRKGSQIGGKAYMTYVRGFWSSNLKFFMDNKDLAKAVQNCADKSKGYLTKNASNRTESSTTHYSSASFKNILLLLNSLFIKYDRNYENHIFIGIYESIEHQCH